MKINANKLKKAIPLIKSYADNRGKHYDQLFPNDGDRYYRNAISAFIRNGKLHRRPLSTSYCYASLFKSVKKEDIILLQLQPCPEDLSMEAYHNYIDWVVNQSPWRHAFVSKNINRILKDGVVVLDRSNSPPFYVKEAAIAVRMAWENYAGTKKYHEIGLWWDVAQKVSPNISYIAAKAMTSPKSNNISTIIRKSSESGHAPINYYYTDDNVHINGWLKEDRHTRGWRRINTPMLIAREIYNTFSLIGKSDTIVNPFVTSYPHSSEYKREAFIEAMHSELPKLEAKFHA